MDDKRSTTTKDVALLLQLRDENQLTLAPEFQRNSVWPRPAKAYLMDTILHNRPIPLLFFGRSVNAQTNRPSYEVIDGQQRLRAVFDYYAGRFSLTESPEDAPWYGKKWKDLDDKSRQRILNYDFVVEELSGYSEADIRDMFRRMNRYVVRLNAQEQRHAIASGRFKEFCEEVGAWPFWTESRIFSRTAKDRRRTDEFAAELAILLLEGAQDKKSSIDLYFTAYAEEFELEDDVRERLLAYTSLIAKALPGLRNMQLRRAANVYALIGALDLITEQGSELRKVRPARMQKVLEAFDEEISSDDPPPHAARYLRAASRQTDNIAPRLTRIRTLKTLLTAGA